jgi:hypothetical protein
MLFGETVAVYCDNHMEHTNTLCGQTAVFLNVEKNSTYSYHCDLTGEIKWRLTWCYLQTAQDGLVHTQHLNSQRHEQCVGIVVTR